MYCFEFKYNENNVIVINVHLWDSIISNACKLVLGSQGSSNSSVIGMVHYDVIEGNLTLPFNIQVLVCKENINSID